MPGPTTPHREVVAVRASIEVSTTTTEKTNPNFRTLGSFEKPPSRSNTKRSSWIVVSQRFVLFQNNFWTHIEYYSNTIDINIIESVIQKAKLKHAEAQKLRAIRSLQDLQTMVGDQEADHRNSREVTARGKFQGALVKINEFGKAYGTVLDSLKEAVPHGGGQAVWVLLGGLFIVADRKNSREKAISEVSAFTFLNAIPRNVRTDVFGSFSLSSCM
jgi:hypothetical protein